jgi:ubiquinone/menaquinone biosynthesis C-methylase UbiE
LENAALNAEDQDPRMNDEVDVKQQVRQFYDLVGWQLVGEDQYQNARYEDLRPVSSEYLHRCHLRVGRQLRPTGRLLLDAGSGPIQYPEYLQYSAGYARRVCADISLVALQAARQRIGDHGLFVVADIANLPFKPGVFDGMVSLHTIHHLPEGQHLQAYAELYRVMASGSAGVVVNGWPVSPLMGLADPLIRLANRLRYYAGRLTGKEEPAPGKRRERRQRKLDANGDPKGTFTNRHDVGWIYREVGACMPVEIRVWRSVSVRFLRALVHPWLGGKYWLRLLYQLEERFPRYFGENGQYPLIVIRKTLQAGQKGE